MVLSTTRLSRLTRRNLCLLPKASPSFRRTYVVAAPAVRSYPPVDGEPTLNSPSELARRISAKVLPKLEKSDVKKVLVVGSGGLSIGQAGEFDYSGTNVRMMMLMRAYGVT